MYIIFIFLPILLGRLFATGKGDDPLGSFTPVDQYYYSQGVVCGALVSVVEYEVVAPFCIIVACDFVPDWQRQLICVELEVVESVWRLVSVLITSVVHK